MIAFRVDANEYTATGHLMRCLAIAVELRKQGKESIFFLAENKETNRIQTAKFPYVILGGQWNNLEKELPVMQEVIKKYSLRCLVVDSYQVTIKYLKQLENMVKVLYIDDMAKYIWPVSIVLHYNDWLEDTVYQEQYKKSQTKVLAGMKYVPLREEFSLSQIKDLNIEKNSRNKSVLITTGGTDTYNVTGSFLKEVFEEQEQKGIQTPKYKTLRNMIFHIIIGSMNQYKEELKMMAYKYSNIILHYNVNTMGDMMRESDFAISAGGTTLFELCACQVPTVCFSFADNQVAFAKKMGEKQVMLYAGDSRYQNVNIAKNLCTGLITLQNNCFYVKKMIENMKLLVDGKGTYRIAKVLIEADEKVNDIIRS